MPGLRRVPMRLSGRKAQSRQPQPQSRMRRARRHQWGTERRTHPLPIVHDRPSTRKIAFSRLAVVATAVLWATYLVTTIIRQFFEDAHDFKFTLEAVCYLIVVTFLTFSALMYLVMRQGALQRFSTHVRVPRAELDRHFATHQPSITVLVPSYSEEPEVIRKTLLSAALQEYPKLRVVLLLDDNPEPSRAIVLARLNATRAIGGEIMRLLSRPRERFNAALERFDAHHQDGEYGVPGATHALATEYHWAAGWLNHLAENEKIEDHVDEFFADQVLRALANELSLTGDALSAAVIGERTELPVDRLRQLHHRLISIFDAELATFERKKFASLSHEANKAMNLNSYIGLMGGTYQQAFTPEGPVLVPVDEDRYGASRSPMPGADAATYLVIPDSDFVLTLDADSVLLREYCSRLVYFLQQPDNARVAVTQTPYSSFRGAPSRIERLAGATTDIQHILHQGMSHYGATFWVGANAVIRKAALDDICEVEWIGGFEVRRYIQDRTVIEDTESSVDLGLHGWTLVNYPERLSYSATPPDFGSLIVQRRRWANGGLLILPKLRAQARARKARGEHVPRMELMIRLNYMASIAWASFGLIFLLAFPYDSRLLSPLVILAALPYFLAMASDLKYCGYKRTDVLRIYGFNLILLPVNLAGVLKSVQQALTSKKIPFARTPKVKNRTLSPALYVILPLLIVAFSVFTMYRDIVADNVPNAVFAGFNAFVAAWAIKAYVGIRNTVVDIWMGLTDWLYVEAKTKASKQTAGAESLDWRAVLYHGHAKEAVPLAAQSFARTAAQSADQSAARSQENIMTTELERIA